jgi:hypothetical protein
MKRNRNYGLPTNVLIDDDVKEFLCGHLNTYGWYIGSTGYCRSGNNKKVLLHRLVAAMYFGLYAIKDKTIDHINGNKLDNRIENLRICTQAENTRNRRMSVNNKSGFKGVSFNKNSNKWRAFIMIDRKQIHLGYFDDVLLAAKAYDEAAKLYHKKYAKLNFI